MPVSTKQFHYLTEMDIPLWQSKETSTVNKSNTADIANIVSIDFNKLIKNQYFTDVLTCLNLTIADCSLTNNKLIFDFFNWQFSNTTEIKFQYNCLTTPPLNELSIEPKLKKQLWLLISNHLIEQI